MKITKKKKNKNKIVFVFYVFDDDLFDFQVNLYKIFIEQFWKLPNSTENESNYFVSQKTLEKV